MRITRALRLPSAACLAFAGSGGKTTAMFRLARELATSNDPPSRPDEPDSLPPGAARVLVTTTTHLGVSQLSLADAHYIVLKPDDIGALETRLQGGVTLVTGPLGADERVNAVDPHSLERLRRLAAKRQIPLLVEADGSRLRPLKAPAAHEPRIPEFVEGVVVAAGLSGLDKPLTESWVHRPELFAALSGLAPGEPIGVEALIRVLSHPDGGLKKIPPGARRMVLLNQADTLELAARAKEFAAALLPHYAAVAVSTFQPAPGRSQAGDGGSEGPVLAVYERIAGIILAAGGSSRYGQPKQLLSWRGKPFVRHVARTALQAGLSPVIVVSGAGADKVEKAVAGLDLQVVYNPDWEAGQSTSLRAGLLRLPAETGAAVFLLADQPQVPGDLVAALAEKHAETLAPLVAPRISGRRANPVLLDRATFPELMVLQGDTGGRGLFSDPDRFPAAWVPWNDPGLLLDVDTPEDYRRLLERD